MNNLEIDDSADGVRKRFTIWTGVDGSSVRKEGVVFLARVYSGLNYDGVIDSPGVGT